MLRKRPAKVNEPLGIKDVHFMSFGDNIYSRLYHDDLPDLYDYDEYDRDEDYRDEF